MALRLPLLAILASLWAHQSLAFSASNANPTLTLFDRFRAVCPADTSCIRQFDASLVSADDKEDDDDDSNAVWVAVYRSNNNKPSVLVKDSFLKAMKSATDTVPVPEPSSDLANSFVQGTGVAQEAPVAVARLVESKDFGNTWIMDSMRCVLKKENTDASCDGGSEHTEALTTGIDTLLLHYLQSLGRDRFEGAIRTKATLVSATLLEDRGFCEVQSLEKDMATHFSSLDDCLEKFATRSVETIAKSPAAQQRALSIVSLLGRIDRQDDLRASAANENDADDADEYDPWASIKKFL